MVVQYKQSAAILTLIQCSITLGCNYDAELELWIRFIIIIIIIFFFFLPSVSNIPEGFKKLDRLQKNC